MAAAGIASIAGKAAGSIVSAVGQHVTRKEQAKAAFRNAAIARQQARLVEIRRDIELKRLKKAKRSFAGTQRSLFAKSGVRSQGSPLEVMSDSASEFEMDIQITQFNADVARDALLSQAGEDARLGKKFKKAAVLEPIVTLLSGGAQSALQFGGSRRQGGGTNQISNQTSIQTSSGTGVRQTGRVFQSGTRSDGTRIITTGNQKIGARGL